MGFEGDQRGIRKGGKRMKGWKGRGIYGSYLGLKFAEWGMEMWCTDTRVRYALLISPHIFIIALTVLIYGDGKLN